MTKRIRTLRRRARLTQAALAARVGISRGYLARLEGSGSRRHDPPISTVRRLARALGVTVAEVLR